MKLKPHGAFLVKFVISFSEGEISREEFDMDYSGYAIEHFSFFEEETPRLAGRFARTVDATYDRCSWMTDDSFQYAIEDALDEFFGTRKIADIY